MHPAKLTKLLILLCFLISSVAFAQRTYYVSNDGNDGNSGTSPSQAWKSLSKVNGTKFQPGDKILLKKGDRWSDRLANKYSYRGSSGRPIVFSSYGSGAMPIIAPSSTTAVRLTAVSYVRFENIHVKAYAKSKGIRIAGDAKYVTVAGCKVEGSPQQNSDHGIVYSSSSGGAVPTYPSVVGNEVYGFKEGIIGIDGLRGGGLIAENYVHSTHKSGTDLIRAINGNYGGLVIRKNKLTKWRDDAIDLFGGDDIVVEYNDIYAPYNNLVYGEAGNGIKMGSTESEDIVARYNVVYNLIGKGEAKKNNGIVTNGCSDCQAYGNLVYNADGIGLRVDPGNNIDIYHNTLLSNRQYGIQILSGTSDVTVKNNILQGSKGAARSAYPTKGSRNLYYKSYKTFSFQDDRRIESSSVFANESGNDYRLKSGAPAIDRGEVVSNYRQGIGGTRVGSQPDIGAYQYGSAAAPNPTENQPPEASAGNDIRVTGSRNELTVKGSGSDSDGSVVSYQWKKISGPEVDLSKTDQAVVTLKNLDEGTYVMELEVKDDDDAKDTDRTTITVTEEPKTPEPPSESLTNGLHYEYYEGEWYRLPDFDQERVIGQGSVGTLTLEPRQQDDFFAFAFTGFIKIDRDDTYTFYLTSDDGSQLFINNTLLVNNDGEHAAREKKANVYLKKGLHPVRITYFERKGKQVLGLQYSSTRLSRQNVPGSILFREDSQPVPPTKPATPEPTASLANGLNYAYYEGAWGRLPEFGQEKIVKQGSVSNITLEPREQKNNFAFVFSGFIRIDQDATYTFYLTSDDGSKLFVNNALLINNDRTQQATEKKANVYLKKGLHPIRVAYFEQIGREVLSLAYSRAGMSKRSVPDNRLFKDETINARVADANLNRLKAAASDTAHTDPVPSSTVDASEIVVYPNKFQDQLTLSLKPLRVGTPYDIRIFDIDGREVLRQRREVTSNKLDRIEVAHLRIGTYTSQLVAGDRVEVIKLIKE